MPRFVIMVNEEYANKWGFDADSIEHAKELMEKIKEGEISVDELPNWYEKNYSIDTTYGELEEVNE